ncbi:uncharacterized protein LOC142642588 isoform X2 [Castanea sativa]|uniref:uncharacterized protein LOC142642588 isoform X2 n=1 Tax=Castanea sativa TaxID=21020 RepID=UPI003F650CE8
MITCLLDAMMEQLLYGSSASCSSEDMRPLLCFSADTVPITAFSWAPLESVPEIANVIVTAGYGGLKFWDLCADGTVLHFQLTSKAVDKVFSRNRTPHFLCGSLTEEESAITINTPLPNTPFLLKNSLNKSGDIPLSMLEIISVAQQVKRGKDKMAKGPRMDAQTSSNCHVNLIAALCYGNDPGTESGPEEALTYSKSKKRPTCRSGNNNNREDDQTLVCRDEEPSKTEGKENGKIEARTNEVFPLKMVAMHKVMDQMGRNSNEKVGRHMQTKR